MFVMVLVVLGVNSTINGNKFIGVSNLALSISSANLTIENNSFFSDTSMAIAILSSNITVKNNIIKISSIGIWVFGKNASLISNTISLVDGYYAVNVESENVFNF